MTFCMVEDGIVVNIIVADDENALAPMVLYPVYEGVQRGERYEPPEEEPVDPPTEEDDINAMLVDHEYRLTLMELGVTEDAI